MTFEEQVERIFALLRASDRFRDVEVLKTSLSRQRGGWFLRIVVDREGGVDTALCEAISNFVTRCVDALPPPAVAYQVEVESAGVERPLNGPDHFRRFVGREARVITSLHIGNRVEFSGTISAADERSVAIDDRYAGRVDIPYPAIKRAHLTYEPRDDLRKRG